MRYRPPRRFPGLIPMLSRSTFVLLAIATAALPAPAAAQDAADFVVRLNRLENQVRQMSGHIEQLQFENRQLKDQLRKFEEDMEFRFQEPRRARAAPRRPRRRGSAASVASPTPACSRREAAPRRCLRPAAPLRTRPARRCRSARRGLPRRCRRTSSPRSRRRPDGPLPRGAIEPGPTIETLIDDEDGRPPGAAPLDLSAAGRVAAAPAPSACARASPRPEAATPAPITMPPMPTSCSGSTSRPRWACGSSCSRIRATGSCRTRSIGSARATSSAAARARRRSSSSRSRPSTRARTRRRTRC